ELIEGGLGAFDLGVVFFKAETIEHRGSIGKRIALPNDFIDLPGWWNHALVSGFDQGLTISLQRSTHLGQARTRAWFHQPGRSMKSLRSEEHTSELQSRFDI